MHRDNLEHNRLSLTFHQTFIPERLYITSFLRFVANGNTGTDQDISEKTGIPVGRSTGKVPAIINYCKGMGLIFVEQKNSAVSRKFYLTSFGRSILLEDANLSEDLSQWLVHLHLCRRNSGAELWYLGISKGYELFGTEFTEQELTAHVERVWGTKNRSVLGPLIRTYEEQASFKTAGVFTRTGKVIKRLPAPLLSSFRIGYSALLLSLWDDHFPDENQVTLIDFERKTYWQRMAGWDSRQNEIALEMVQEAGAIRIDKQMRPWILRRCTDTNKLWPSLYDELA